MEEKWKKVRDRRTKLKERKKVEEFLVTDKA